MIHRGIPSYCPYLVVATLWHTIGIPRDDHSAIPYVSLACCVYLGRP
nr:MAG TPA: hypothetical protein [Caudoviricetes sp.]